MTPARPGAYPYAVHALFNGERRHGISRHRTLEAAIQSGRSEMRAMAEGWGVLLTLNGIEPDAETHRLWTVGLMQRGA